MSANSGASQPVGAGRPAETLKQPLRTFGTGAEKRQASQEERQLAVKLRRATDAGQVSSEQESELAALSANSGASEPVGADILMQRIRNFECAA